MADKKPVAATEAEKTKTPRERFTSTGINRVNSALDALRILGNVSDRTTYEYTAAEWAKVQAAVQAKWTEVQQGFTDALAGKTKKTIKQGFGL